MNRPAIDVLLIDDEPAMLKVMACCLAQNGFTFRQAGDGRAAIPLLAQHRFKLIVTDIHMPEMDGFEVIMHCTAAMPEATILAISGGGNYELPNGVLKPARLLGCRRTLAKPFTSPEFLQIVNELV
jgi:CheY-like chemotaxis protein